MKNEHIFIKLILAIFFLFIHTNTSYSSEETPEGLVGTFYDWYIERLQAQHLRDEPMSPEKDDIIYNYVYECTVNKYRINVKKGIADSDYFLKSNDFMYEYFKKIYKAQKAVKINDSLSIVPVGDEQPHLIVFVQKTKAGWRIIKVEAPGVDSDPLWRW